VPSNARADSTPKSKYLKKPSTPRFSTTVAASQRRRVRALRARAMALPSSQSAVDDSQISGTKR
jgi:hypothetical protein